MAAKECGLQIGAVGAICTPILAFVSIFASVQVSLDAFEHQIRRHKAERASAHGFLKAAQDEIFGKFKEIHHHDPHWIRARRI